VENLYEKGKRNKFNHYQTTFDRYLKIEGKGKMKKKPGNISSSFSHVDKLREQKAKIILSREHSVTSLSRCTTLGRFRVPTPMDCLKATYGLAQST